MLNHDRYFPAPMCFEICGLGRVSWDPTGGGSGAHRPFQVVTYKPVNTVRVEGVPPERIVSRSKSQKRNVLLWPFIKGGSPQILNIVWSISKLQHFDWS